ncbi:MAG: Methionine--tRNA ligase [Methanomassiliicoccales archaeon PtaU1.Bin124]|nr:MAG: Methionine--tRNA ligase [Methanomassiliicoccales archaeon PtaU1.Bin124]
MAKVLVCVAWPYSNSAIHLGHVAGSLLPPDIFAKFHILKGDDVLMVSGSDQHGTPVTVTAEREGTTPEAVAERCHNINKKAIEDLGIGFSLFTKTHTQNHYDVVHDVFNTLLEKGHLYKKGTMQYYCPKCTKFLPDRYVEGTCKKCGNERSRGDQCENCGTTFEPGELLNPHCTNCGSTPVLKESEHYFLRLSEFQQPLLEYVSKQDHWRANTKLFTSNWLEAGLKDRAITRDMSWGVSVPVPGNEGKVIYVWFEAVIGYLSASKEWAKLSGDPDAWKVYWQDPTTKGYYFLGKDNIPFHTIIWPAMLMGYGGLNLPYDVPANEYLTFKGEKFSKSRGVGIDVPSILQKFEPDLVRYYLAANMPEGKDSDFSWDDFDARINNELVATLGNYYHRVLSFTHKNFGEVPQLQMEGTEKEREEVFQAIAQAKADIEEHISTCQFKKALKAVMDLAQFGNRFFDAVAPWSLVKSDKAKCGSMLNLNLEIVKSLALFTYPFLPFSAAKAWEMLGMRGRIGKGSWTWLDDKMVPGQKLELPRPLFTKIVVEKESVNMFQEFSKLNLKVAQIKDVQDHPNAEKLYVLKLDAGKEVQLVAGIKAWYPKDKLIGKKIVYISNLQPAKLRGVESQGMMLAAEADEKVYVLTPGDDAAPGDPVNSGLEQSEKQLSFSDFQKFLIRTGHVSGAEVDLGRKVSVKFPAGSKVPSQVAVFLPTADAKEGLPLYTSKGVVITVDGELGNGAQVR